MFGGFIAGVFSTLVFAIFFSRRHAQKKARTYLPLPQQKALRQIEAAQEDLLARHPAEATARLYEALAHLHTP